MELLKFEKLTNTPWLNLFCTEVKNTKGKIVEWYFASRDKNPLNEGHRSCAVLIVPIIKDEEGEDNVIITKEYRYPLGDYMYGFPAGIIDEGDTLEQTIQKEMKEETGLEIFDIIDVSPPLYTSPGFSNECINIAFVNVTGEVSKEFQENSEEIEVFIYDIQQVEKLLNECTLNKAKLDAKVWPILQSFVCRGKISFNE
jgi:ADP-ribose pyrophosphatase